jgi:xylan 1,4-beta-xylosidase
LEQAAQRRVCVQNWQAQLATIQGEIVIQKAVHTQVAKASVYTEDKQGNPQINFQYIDTLYDALLKLHIRPFVELAFMPSKLATGTSTIFWWKGNTSPRRTPRNGPC